MMPQVLERSTVVQAFIDGAAANSPMRCGVVVAPGGYGKSILATEVVAALKTADVLVTFVSGDLAFDLDLALDPSNGGAVVLDAAEVASDALLERLRAEAADPNSDRSILVFSRSISSSPALAALCALADRDSTLEELDPFSPDDITSRLPKSSTVSAEDVDELTCSIPALVDRLCTGWDETGWPTEPVSSVEQLPKRFLRHVELELSQLDDDARRQMAAGAVAVTTSRDTGAELNGQPTASGLVSQNGRMPLAVGYAVEHLLTSEERRGAVIASAQELIHRSPEGAALAFSHVGADDLAAIALAAAGKPDSATELLVDLPKEGAAAAAGAHVAGVESRWADASQLVGEVGDHHPYWSPDAADDARSIYTTIAGDEPPVANGFASQAAAAMRAALSAATESDIAGVADDLRALARQAKNQPPTVDVAVTGAELASLAALTINQFDIARTVLDAAPEAPNRSSLSTALHAWSSVRTGQPFDLPDVDAQTIAADTLRLAAALIDARRGSDAASTVEIVSSIAGLVAQMSVDLLTFDALCEVHVGAHRSDARSQAHQLSQGLERFVDQRQSPLLAVRLAWSRIEAAVSAGDPEAVSKEQAALTSIKNVTELAPALVAAAVQWSAIFTGVVDGDAVQSAISDLEVAGYLWEAAALAGQAAIRTDDGALAKELLAIGREFRAAAPEQKITSPAGLSEREIEIGLLVLKGHSYKEIGAECFISPKTVEHHVAHIRQKLIAVGVPRAEFRAKLQADLSPE